METTSIRCLVLACGNTTRSDDGVGPFLAEWAEERFRNDTAVRVVSRQQWTPELAEEVAVADSVLFLDSSVDSLPARSVSFPSKQKLEDREKRHTTWTRPSFSGLPGRYMVAGQRMRCF